MAMARQTFPVGALVQAFLTLGIAKAAIQFWPDIVSGTTAQINAFASVLGVDGADPFEVIAAGGALASLAFNHADAAAGYFSGWITSIFYFLAGIVIIICYAVISGLSLLAWVEFWAAAIILFPLVAMLGIAGFSQAAFVPISFLLSSTMRIAAIAMIAGYGSDLMAEYALPDMTDTVTWLNGFAAIILAGVLCLLTYGCNKLILSILMGRPGFTIGAATLLSTISGAGSMVASRVSGAAGSSGGGGAAGATTARAGGSGGGQAAGHVGARATPVNSRTTTP